MRHKYDRAQRKADRKRIYAKRVRQNLLVHRAFDSSVWVHHNALRRIDTGCPCSCSMCTSPRANYGNSKLALTRSELKALNSMKDDLSDQ